MESLMETSILGKLYKFVKLFGSLGFRYARLVCDPADIVGRITLVRLGLVK